MAGNASGLTRKGAGAALMAVLLACSPAPPATSAPTASSLPSPSPVTSQASASAPPSNAPPPPSPAAPAPSAPPATPDPAYLGAFAVLPAGPRAAFDGQIECTGTIGATDPVALVSLKGERHGVLRDYADVRNPRTACTFARANVVQIIDPHHVVVSDGHGLYAVVDLPKVRYRWFQLPRTKGWGQELITVGRDLDRVVWKAVRYRDTETDAIFLSTASHTRTLATLPDTNEGRCGSPTDSSFGGYTTSGSYLFVLNQPMLSNHSLVVFKGRQAVLSIVPPHTEWAGDNAPYAALWSPVSATLYWTQKGDVWRWTPDGGKQLFLAGVEWFLPTISADGRYLAYETATSDHVFLVDLVSGGGPHKIGQPGGQPRFVNATQLWYRVDGGVPGCTGPQPPAEHIYDVTDGSEAGSIIDWVSLTWPATSGRS